MAIARGGTQKLHVAPCHGPVRVGRVSVGSALADAVSGTPEGNPGRISTAPRNASAKADPTLAKGVDVGRALPAESRNGGQMPALDGSFGGSDDQVVRLSRRWRSGTMCASRVRLGGRLGGRGFGTPEGNPGRISTAPRNASAKADPTLANGVDVVGRALPAESRNGGQCPPYMGHLAAAMTKSSASCRR
jgi:hypothetical protein